MTTPSAAVLVIDDEPVICKGCQMILSEHGFRVTVCHNGGSGLKTARRGGADIVLLDMKLPDADGMDILKTLRQEAPHVYVIVMTGYSSVKNAVDAMRIGAFDYLAKPFNDNDLLFAVQRAAESKRLKEENLSLRKQLFERFDFNNIVGENPRILDIFEQVQRVAPTDSTVLIEGESGTGKELFAGAIHAHSPRSARQFVAVDCSTLSAGLLESELFGHVKGAFTGAVQHKQGIFAVADGGSLFLDEISNLNLEMQAKLLRVMETREFKPVGASRFVKTDVRIIAATNRDLRPMMAEGAFREDLFYRLNVFPVRLPPLRERKDDIPRLSYHFLRFFCRKTGKRIEGFSDDAIQMMVDYHWPGNVRQLKNAIERLVILSDRRYLDRASLVEHFTPLGSETAGGIPKTLDALKTYKKHLLEERYGAVEKAFLIEALDACNGNITRAAKQVGMQRSNFSALMKKHGISAHEKNAPQGD